MRHLGYIQLATRGRQIQPPHPQWSHIGDTSGAAERGLPPRWEQVEGSQGRRSWTQEVWSYGLWVGIIICNTSPSYSVSNNRKISLFDEYNLLILEESVTKTGCDTWLKIFFERKYCGVYITHSFVFAVFCRLLRSEDDIWSQADFPWPSRIRGVDTKLFFAVWIEPRGWTSCGCTEWGGKCNFRFDNCN